MARTRPLALITGASSGLGAEFARQLAARGFDLVLVARRGDRLEALGNELRSRSRSRGIEAQPLVADLTCEAEVKAVEEYIAGTENLELLVNNAGFGTKGRFFDTDVSTQDAMHRLHVMATLRLTHAALVKMTARRKGAVINVSSMAAFAPRVGSTSYYATKAWMNCFTEGLYLELKGAGSPVRVQALCPGFTITEFHDAMGVDRKVVPSGLWMSAADVVAASLRGLARDKLFVVPGLPYKFFFFILRLLPRFLLHVLAIKNPTKWESR